MFPEVTSTFSAAYPDTDLLTIAGLLEEWYFAPGFTHFATKGGDGDKCAPWYYYKMGPGRMGWCRSGKTNRQFSLPFDLTQHLWSARYYGTCSRTPTGTRFAALDFDNLADPQEETLLQECIAKARNAGMLPHLVYTGNNLHSGNHLGVHLEFFFDQVQSIADVRSLLDWVTDGRHDRPSTAYPEAFPTTGGKAYRLPFGVHKQTGNLAVFVDPDSYSLIENQGEYIASINGRTCSLEAIYMAKSNRRVACSTPLLPTRVDSLEQRPTPPPAPTPTSCVIDSPAPHPEYPINKLLQWLHEGYCPPHSSFAVMQAYAYTFARQWRLPWERARELLVGWNEKLCPTSHSSPLEQRLKEAEWLLRNAYTPQRQGVDSRQVLMEYSQTTAKPIAENLVASQPELLARLKEDEPRPDCTRKAIIDVLSVFVAADNCIADTSGAFYLGQRLIQQTLGSSPNRVNRVLPYVVLRECAWGKNPPCNGYFYKQVTYPEWRTKQAPQYRRIEPSCA